MKVRMFTDQSSLSCSGYCDEVLSKLRFEHPTYVLVLADHGEAMGEDHKIGHGIYAHSVEFEVPFQCKLIIPQPK